MMLQARAAVQVVATVLPSPDTVRVGVTAILVAPKSYPQIFSQTVRDSTGTWVYRVTVIYP